MCDKAHYERLEGRMDELEDSVAVYHAKTDERLKTLFVACGDLKDSMKIARNVVYVTLCFVTVVTVLALVFGAVGERGFNAVTRAAQEAQGVR